MKIINKSEHWHEWKIQNKIYYTLRIFLNMNNLPLVVVVYTHYLFFQRPESLNDGKKEKYFSFYCLY